MGISNRITRDLEKQNECHLDLIELFAEYANIPQSWDTGKAPAARALMRFKSEADQYGQWNWDAAEMALQELCPDGRVCTVNAFRAVYRKYWAKMTGAKGCSICGDSGIVFIVHYRDRQKRLHIIDTPEPCEAYRSATPCRCPKGRLVQSMYFGHTDKHADYAYSKRTPEEFVDALVNDCRRMLREQHGKTVDVEVKKSNVKREHLEFTPCEAARLVETMPREHVECDWA